MSDKISSSAVLVEDPKGLTVQKPAEKLQLRSELAQEVVSRQPDFFERKALYIFAGILLTLLAGAWLFRYPDTVRTRVTLTAANAPKEIVMRTDGRLVKLLVQNDEHVKKGSIIGWIESTASHKEVIRLSEMLDSSIHLLESDQPQKAAHLFAQRFKGLGELQASYQQFIATWQQYNDYLSDGFYVRRKQQLENDIKDLDLIRETVQLQMKYTAEDVNLATESFRMNDSLLADKVISREEYRREKSRFLNKQSAMPEIEASIISNRYQRRDKQKEIQLLEHDISQQEIIFLQAIQSLKSAVDEWMLKYVLQSPVDGKISFIISLQENQFLPTGRLIGYINPPDSHFFAEAYLSQSNFGKIDTGLKVQLRFDAYPYQEFGYVPGTLNYISRVGTDSGFMATIRLDNGLVTDQHKSISYKNGLKAQGLIITKDMRLLERFYYDIVKVTSTGSK